MKKHLLLVLAIMAAAIILLSFLSFNISKNTEPEAIIAPDSQTVTESSAVADDAPAIDDAPVINEIPDPNEAPKELDDMERPIIIKDGMYREFESQIDIYDSMALNKFLGAKYIKIDDITEAVDNNDNIDDQWKEIIKDFARRITDEFPEIDMRLFYENVKRLSIEYDSYEELKERDFLAFYRYTDGTIHVSKDINLTPGSYDLMVVRHEIGHMISLGTLKNDEGKKIVCTIQFDDYGQYLSEAIDVYISSKPYEQEYNFEDFGYGIVANELSVIIDAIPDLNMSMLANHDVYDIADYLDQINPNTVAANRFIDLLDKQAIDYYDYSTDEPAETDFRDIYIYIANTYVDHVLDENMSREKIEEIRDNLKASITHLVPSNYEPVGIEEIDDVFGNYMLEKGLTDKSDP